MCVFVPHVPMPIIIKNPAEPTYVNCFNWVSNFFNTIYFGRKGSCPFLLIQNSRYLVSVCPKNYFTEFNFNPASESFCRNFQVLSDILKSCVWLLLVRHIYTHVPYQTPWNFWTSFPERYQVYWKPQYTFAVTRTLPTEV